MDNKQELLEKTYRIVDELGVENQLPIWIEELSELIKELCKWQRIYKQVGNDIPLSLRQNILTESIDVENSLNQIRHVLRFTEIEQEMEYSFKVDRTIKKYLETGENNE